MSTEVPGFGPAPGEQELRQWRGLLRGEARVFEPECCIAADAGAMSRMAAERVREVLLARRDALVGLTTGASPVGLYAHLVEMGRQEPDLFRQARWLALDEWGGLSGEEEGSNERYLWERLLGPLGVRPGQYCGWRGLAEDPAAECRRVAEWLRAQGPMDLCILGVGVDGHVGMMEPGPAVLPGPHAVELSAGMRSHPTLGRASGRVKFGFTLGMGDLLGARRILLLATGSSKAPVLRRFWETREVTPWFPVSFLWLHPAVVICCDMAAAAEIPRSGVGHSRSTRTG